MKKNIDKLRLKQNWDASWADFNGNALEPIFVGRDKEISRIISFIKSNRQGALFIGGENGSGKTNTVFKALSEIDIKFKLIRINHVFLEGKDNKSTTKSLIKQLIRALYDQLPTKCQRDKEIKLLYDDINATKILDSSSENKKIVWTQELQLPIDIIVRFFSLIFLSSGLFQLVVINFFDNNPDNFALKLTSALVQILLSMLGFSYSRSREKSNSKLVEIDGISIHQLQFRTSKVLKKIQEILGNDTELIILLDELDYFDFLNSSDHTTNDDVQKLLQTLKSLKLLLNDISATFIFLIGEKTYATMNQNPYTTVATDRFFISKANPGELEKYIATIFEKPTESQLQWLEIYGPLKIKESNANFYNLIALIRDDLFYENNEAELTQNEFTTFDRVKSILVRASFQFIDKYTQPLGKAGSNNNLFLTMMSVIDHFEKTTQSVGGPLSLPDNKIIEEAVVAYINYIFTTTKKLNPSVSIPQYDKSNRTYSQISWVDVLNMSEPEILTNKVTKAILPEEIEVSNQFDKLLSTIEQIEKTLGIGNEKNLVRRIETICKKVSFPTRPRIEYAQELETAMETINSIPFQDRPTDFRDTLNSKVIPASNNLLELMSQKYFITNTTPLIVKRVDPLNAYNSQDAGGKKIIFELGKKEHIGGSEFSSFATIAHPIESQKMSIKFEAYMQPESVVNIIFGIKPWSDNFVENEFLMFRLDTRENTKEGIFIKKKGQVNWQEKNVTSKLGHTTAREITTFWIRLNNREISLNKPRWNSIVAKERINKIYWWGVANELQEVELTIFNDTIPHSDKNN